MHSHQHLWHALRTRQGHIVLLQIWGAVLTAGLMGRKPLCKSLYSSRLWDSYESLCFNSESYKCTWYSRRPSPYLCHTDLALAKTQKALSPLQSARMVTWIRGERHKSDLVLFLLQKCSWQATQENPYFIQTGDGIWRQILNLLIKS